MRGSYVSTDCKIKNYVTIGNKVLVQNNCKITVELYPELRWRAPAVMSVDAAMCY